MSRTIDDFPFARDVPHTYVVKLPKTTPRLTEAIEREVAATCKPEAVVKVLAEIWGVTVGDVLLSPADGVGARLSQQWTFYIEGDDRVLARVSLNPQSKVSEIAYGIGTKAAIESARKLATLRGDPTLFPGYVDGVPDKPSKRNKRKEKAT